MSLYANSVFIFRRDLRLQDNTGLNQALKLSAQVLPCFIFDPRQIEPHPYQSKPGLKFMLESIKYLQHDLLNINAELGFYNDLPEAVLKQLIKDHAIEAVFINRDYTPFSRQRDYQLGLICNELELKLHVCADALLTEPEQAVKQDNSAYKVFTAFYNNAARFPVALPEALSKTNFVLPKTAFNLDTLNYPDTHLDKTAILGGRQQALDILNDIDAQADYTNTRDFPSLNSTSKLSAHLKFGTCSVREAYYAIVEALGSDHPLLRQLYWRDFFTHIGYHFPKVFGHAFIDKFDALQWQNNVEHFKAWAEGRTGFPIVDAGMRELNQTGFMHNRVRMIVASFLVKDLHISWRWGERYFAQHLVDYDPCVNNGNWQWAASTGCDAQPYFRIFNPWLQQQKFDADCQYIYHWLPELKGYTAKTIHQWDKKHQAGAYPAPMIDHAIESQWTKAWFKESAGAEQLE